MQPARLEICCIAMYERYVNRLNKEKLISSDVVYSLSSGTGRYSTESIGWTSQTVARQRQVLGMVRKCIWRALWIPEGSPVLGGKELTRRQRASRGLSEVGHTDGVLGYVCTGRRGVQKTSWGRMMVGECGRVGGRACVRGVGHGWRLVYLCGREFRCRLLDNLRQGQVARGVGRSGAYPGIGSGITRPGETIEVAKLGLNGLKGEKERPVEVLCKVA